MPAPTPGPWVQPADVLRTANRTVTGGGNAPYTSSAAASFAATFSSLLSSTTLVTPDDEVATPNTGTDLDHESVSRVSATVTLVRFDPQFVSLTPVAPPPADLAAPHVVGYEYEGGSGALGVLIGPMVARSWMNQLTGDFNFTFTAIPPTGEPVAYRVFEMVEGTDYSLAPVAFSGATFQQVHALLYPNQAVLAGRTEVASNFAGNVPDEVTQDALTGVSWTVPSSLPAYAFVAHNLVDGSDIVGGDTLAFVSYSPHVDFSAWVRPPRYRLLYDVLPPLRQYPRDDGVTGNSAPRQGRDTRSVQASTRQGWRGTYR